MVIGFQSIGLRAYPERLDLSQGGASPEPILQEASGRNLVPEDGGVVYGERGNYIHLPLLPLYRYLFRGHCKCRPTYDGLEEKCFSQ